MISKALAISTEVGNFIAEFAAEGKLGFGNLKATDCISPSQVVPLQVDPTQVIP